MRAARSYALTGSSAQWNADSMKSSQGKPWKSARSRGTSSSENDNAPSGRSRSNVRSEARACEVEGRDVDRSQQEAACCTAMNKRTTAAPDIEIVTSADVAHELAAISGDATEVLRFNDLLGPMPLTAKDDARWRELNGRASAAVRNFRSKGRAGAKPLNQSEREELKELGARRLNRNEAELVALEDAVHSAFSSTGDYESHLAGRLVGRDLIRHSVLRPDQTRKAAARAWRTIRKKHLQQSGAKLSEGASLDALTAFFCRLGAGLASSSLMIDALASEWLADREKTLRRINAYVDACLVRRFDDKKHAEVSGHINTLEAEHRAQLRYRRSDRKRKLAALRHEEQGRGDTVKAAESRANAMNRQVEKWRARK